ncbi:ABC transporter related protein [Candidatus Moduliflexus flocculans]|uniref:ABC transporter related protein n=1 Tax=Candidatus Moduliflexus flocculans TaxID=1499966 RepID=A0A0S6W0V7_9BACT|nr:ABC transporter related protein [Candidatus Moduliflexus flocculans]
MIIQVKNLSKSFEYYKKELGLKNSLKNLFFRQTLTKEAVRGISFDVEEGEMVGFLGPNGAGKTTTLKMLSGILHPTSGQANILGFTPWERKKAFKMQFAIVMGQKNQLWWDLPANESLYLNKCIYEIDDRVYQSTLAELTELLDVKELLSVQVRRLSLGERMKMELIAALIHKPKLIFLDEPTIGLDIVSQKRIREFFKYYNQQKKATVILTSHYMADVEDLCKRTIIINQGRTVFDGDLNRVNELFAQSKIVKLQLSSPVERAALAAFGEVKEHSDVEAMLEVPRVELKARSKAMLDQLPIVDFTIEDIPIEEGIALLYQAREATDASA